MVMGMVIEMTPMTDPFVLNTPRWLSVVVSTVAEVVLLVVTIAIITAMWLPAYLNSRGVTADTSGRNREDMPGMFPRGR
jgi:hypothetical protein